MVAGAAPNSFFSNLHDRRDQGSENQAGKKAADVSGIVDAYVRGARREIVDDEESQTSPSLAHCAGDARNFSSPHVPGKRAGDAEDCS